MRCFKHLCFLWSLLMLANAAFSENIKITVLQAGTNHSKNGNPGLEKNFELFCSLARAAAKEKPDLIVFPEYAISGWPYPNVKIINSISEPVPGEGYYYTKYKELAKEIGVPVLGWMLDNQDGKLFNTGFIVDEKGTFLGKYHKVQTNLGEQTWWGWTQGESFAPIDLKGTKIGVSICADMFFPETVRCLELSGADVVVHMSIADDMQQIVPVRAMDSKVPIVMAIFNGGCYAVDYDGNLLEKLPAKKPMYKMYDISLYEDKMSSKYGGWLPKTGNKNIRNVGAYQALTDPSKRPAWTDVFVDKQGNKQSREELLKRFKGIYDQDDPWMYHEELITFQNAWSSPYEVDAKYPYHFVNRDGKHLYVLNKTAWAYFGCERPEEFLIKAREQGVNVLRVALEGEPYLSHLGIKLWPWGGSRENPDWNSFNESYWDEVEKRIRLAGEHGMGINLTIYFTLHPQAGDIPVQKKYWDYILRRLGKYSNIFAWEMANEYIGNEEFQDAAGSFFQEQDIWNRPVITSTGTTDDAVWPNKDWMDMALVHTCTGSTDRYPLKEWYQAIAMNTRSYGKPALNNESGREIRHKNDDPVHRRKQSWIWGTAGAYWTWHSWEGCEGINDMSYNGPGAEFLRPFSDFFNSLPFWLLSPNYTTAVADGDIICNTLADPERSLIVSYMCTSETNKIIRDQKINTRLPNGGYTVSFIDPATLSSVGTVEFESKGLHQVVPLAIPEFADDIVIKIENTEKRERKIIVGTE